MIKKLLFFVCALAALGQAQVAPVLMPMPEQQFFNSVGASLSNGFVFTYFSGTFTPAPTYTDATGSTQNTNPVQLNAAGYPQTSGGAQVGIWLTPNVSYRIVLQNASHVQQYQIDGIAGVGLAPYQKIGANGVPATVNAATAAIQVVYSLGTLGAGQLNRAGATVHMKMGGQITGVLNAGTTATFSMCLSYSGNNFLAGVPQFVAPITATAPLAEDVSCTTTVTGSTGQMQCSTLSQTNSANTLNGSLSNLVSGIDLTQAISVGPCVQFSTASAVNSFTAQQSNAEQLQ